MYTDSHVSTKYHWARPHTLSPESTATITWDIPEGTLSGEPCISYQELKCAMTAATSAPVFSAKMAHDCSYLFIEGGLIWGPASSRSSLKGTLHDAGTYRLRHFGDYKHIFGGPVAFNGTSSSFEVRTPNGLCSCICSRSGPAATARVVFGASKNDRGMRGCLPCI